MRINEQNNLDELGFLIKLAKLNKIDKAELLGLLMYTQRTYEGISARHRDILRIVGRSVLHRKSRTRQTKKAACNAKQSRIQR